MRRAPSCVWYRRQLSRSSPLASKVRSRQAGAHARGHTAAGRRGSWPGTWAPRFCPRVAARPGTAPALAGEAAHAARGGRKIGRRRLNGQVRVRLGSPGRRAGVEAVRGGRGALHRPPPAPRSPGRQFPAGRPRASGSASPGLGFLICKAGTTGAVPAEAAARGGRGDSRWVGRSPGCGRAARGRSGWRRRRPPSFWKECRVRAWGPPRAPGGWKRSREGGLGAWGDAQGRSLPPRLPRLRWHLFFLPGQVRRR